MRTIFYNDNTLMEYECSGDWEKCISYLLDLTQLRPHDKHILYRLAAEAWYILTFWDCNIPNQLLERTLYEKALKTSYDAARKKWWNDEDCLWLFGYFMCINQIDFPYISADIREVEQEGIRLINLAAQSNPDNLAAKVLSLADSNKKREFKKGIKELITNIKQYFTDDSKVDRYFAEVFLNMA